MNAYTDDKFNKEVDIKTGYKTNTILTVPIKDDSVIENGKRIIGIFHFSFFYLEINKKFFNILIGVCQAINKKGHNATFSKDDESLLTILSNLAGIVLKNSMVYDKQLSFHNSLRSALKVIFHRTSKLIVLDWSLFNSFSLFQGFNSTS